MRPLIILAGPTASGKTTAALALAEALDTEIISADSMQVYKYFNIGTGKPAKEIRQKIVHHLIDILEPQEEFNAFEFKSRAIKHADDLIRRNKIPIVAGGTGLYLKIFLKDFECAVVVSPGIRDKVKSEIKKRGSQKMHAELAKVDPRSAEKILPTDRARIERALSVYSQTGKPLSQFHAGETLAAHNFEPYFFSLDWDRRRLYENIEARVDSMMRQGWVNEVKGLLHKGKHLKPFQAIGYAQIVKHLEEKTPLEQTVREIKQETRHYAKRQLTWFRKVSNLISIPVKPGDTPSLLKDKILSYLPSGAALLLAAFLFTAMPNGLQAEESTSYHEGLRFFKQAEYAEATTQFLQVRSYLMDEWESKRAVYLLGLISAKKKQYGKAIEYFKTALNEFPEIEDYIRFELADAYYQSGKHPAALEEINHLLKTYQTTRSFPQAELLRAEILQLQGKTSQAIDFLTRAVKRITRKRNDFKIYLPELIFKLAQLHEGQNSKAHTWYKKLYIEYPTHPLTARAALKMDELSRQPGFSPPPIKKKERSRRIKSLLTNAAFNQAVEEINSLKEKYGTAPLPGPLYIQLAKAYKGMGRRDEVHKTLDTFLKTYPSHQRTQEVMFLLGRNLWNLGQNQKGIEQFRSSIQINPKTHWGIRGRFFLGKLLESNKRFAPAREQFSLLARHRKNDYRERAAWRLGWLDYQEKKYEKAVTQFKKNADRWPKGELIEANLFWMAKALKKTGQTRQAQATYRQVYARFPYTFHGVRARQRLENRKPGASTENNEFKNTIMPVFLNEATHPGTPPKPRLSGKQKLRALRAREMTAMRLMDNAKFEIQQFEGKIRKNYSGIMWMAELYNEAESYPQAYRLLELFKNFKTKAREKELPVRFWKFFYPLAYADSISSHAKAFDVDPLLAKSIIRQESLFDKHSLSMAGARGLMQIMPKTGERLFTSATDPQPFKADDLFDPDLNIRLGMTYLKELKEKYDNNRIHMLICYNAGPEALERWLKRFQEVSDPDVFIEMIPYPETRSFVKRVLRNYGVYQTLYDQPA